MVQNTSNVFSLVQKIVATIENWDQLSEKAAKNKQKSWVLNHHPSWLTNLHNFPGIFCWNAPKVTAAAEDWHLNVGTMLRNFRFFLWCESHLQEESWFFHPLPQFWGGVEAQLKWQTPFPMSSVSPTDPMKSVYLRSPTPWSPQIADLSRNLTKWTGAPSFDGKWCGKNGSFQLSSTLWKDAEKFDCKPTTTHHAHTLVEVFQMLGGNGPSQKAQQLP